MKTTINIDKMKTAHDLPDSALPAFCYSLLPLDLTKPRGSFISVIVITRGESGYKLTDWKYKVEDAEAAVARLNLKLTPNSNPVTQEVAEVMFLRSMGKWDTKPLHNYKGIYVKENKGWKLVAVINGDYAPGSYTDWPLEISEELQGEGYNTKVVDLDIIAFAELLHMKG